MNRLDQQLCFSLYRASRAVIRAYTPLLEPLGITYPQYLVFLVLWQSDDISVTQLGERLALDSATLTPLLKKLEGKHLVARRRDTEDERTVKITLTKEGRALQERAKRFPEKIACAMGVSIESSADVARLMKLKDELDKIVLSCAT